MALSGSLPQINLGIQGRALDRFEVLGYRVVEDKSTDYAHLKQALSEQFPVVRNRSELETRFYSSSQKHNQKPSDFVYGLSKIHKILKLEMTEEKLIDHIISSLEPQFLDCVEVRHSQTTSNLLQIIDKYEERFLSRKIRGIGRKKLEGNNRNADNGRPRRVFNRLESQGVADNRRFDGRCRDGQSDHRFYNQGCRQGGSSTSAFRGVAGGFNAQNNGLPPDSPEVYRFAIDYRKLNALTKYPRYPLPVIDDLITKHSAYRRYVEIGFKSGYF
ncbi:uncharacterized protein TNCV_1181411 [Trichonephila clavipes]|nr:uncharacterized protein TNCV_1181411 [Trichonephila clavipes]